MAGWYWQGLGVLPDMTFDGVPFQITLSSDEPFGQGGSADIYKGTVLGSHPDVVAVKFFRDFGTIPKAAREQLLERELKAARQVSMRHPSILPFLGTAYAGPREGIVSLYMKNGNLRQYLKSNPDCNKKEMIIQVAEAVAHLHSVENMVHGDLKCENVLVSDSGQALLADFGLSRFLDVVQSVQATETGIRRMYTLRFAAPELLDSEEDDGDKPPSKTRESDVYAFGMLALEAVTEELPWSGALPTSMRKDMLEMTIISRVLRGQHPPQPTLSSGFVSISHAWWDVFKSCWSREPGHRPRMPSVLDALRNTNFQPHRRLEGHDFALTSVAYIPGGRRVVSASWDRTIRIWDTLTHRTVIGPLRGHLRPVDSVAVSPDGLQICSGGRDRTIRRWDAESGAPIGHPMTGHDDGVRCLAFSADSKRIVSGSYDNTVRLWDATTGEALGGPLAGHTGRVRSVAFSHDGACIASGSSDGTIRLWDSATGEDLGVLNRRETEVSSVCFSPDRIHLVSGCTDRVMRIWNVSTRQLARNIKTHSGVSSVAVSPSGRYIASGSYDQTIRIWDAQTGDAVGAPLTGHASWIYSVAFAPDGRSLASCSEEPMVRIWDLFE